jgi:hypothetical protein
MKKKSDEDIAKAYLIALEFEHLDIILPMFIGTVQMARKANPTINSLQEFRQWVRNLPFEVEPDLELEVLA